MSRLCDEPFGAVKLALGPSCCTTVPEIAILQKDHKRKAPHPSPRQYPSARLSKVWHHPQDDVIPAIDAAQLAT
jgi:hypothetical protein